MKSLVAVCFATGILLVGSTSAFASFGYLGGMNNFGGGASGTLLQLDQPQAVARSADGSFFIADSNNSRVLKLDSTGQFVLTWGFLGTGDGQFNGIWDIDIAPDGTVFVADISNHRIQWFSQDGTFIGKLGGPTTGTGAGQFNQPAGVAVAPDGSVWVADLQNDRLQHFTLTAGVANTPTIHGANGTGDGQFVRPMGIDVDPADSSIFVVDRQNMRVQHLSSVGAFINKFGTNNAAPTGMGAPRDVVVNTGVTPHEVLVSNNYIEHRVQRWTTTGTFVDFWGDVDTYFSGCISGFSHMCYPAGLFVDGSTLWVTDSANYRIVSYEGIDALPYVAPVATTAYGTNGSGAGQMNNPRGIATASDGSAYVTDVDNHRVQHWSAAGQLLSTFGSAGTGDGQFQRLSGIEVAPNGDVYVLEYSNEAQDSNTARIQRFDADGNYEMQFNGLGTTAGALSGAHDLAIDGAGNVFVSDGGNFRVVKFDANGGYLGHWGQQGLGDDNSDIDTPYGIAVNEAGTKVYVVDYYANRVKSFEGDGTFIAQSSPYQPPSSIPERFDNPTGIDVDPVTGTVLVSDSDNRRIKRLDASTLAFVSNFGALGSKEGFFLYPEGVAIDADGYTWITDSRADRLQRYGDAPQVQITSPTNGASLVGGTGLLQYSVTDAGADCTVGNGSSIGPLAAGSHTISVSCSNAQGVGAASVTIGVPAPLVPPVTPPATGEVTLKLPKKLKLNKSRKLKFTVTCPDGCTITPKLLFGKKSSRIKQVRRSAGPGPQAVTIKLSSTQGAKAKAWMASNKKVYLTVTVQSYKATQGKTGKASVAK